MAPLATGAFLSLLGEYAFKSTVVLGLALVLARLARSRTASFRHFVLSLGLLGLLGLPLLSLSPFGWETRVLPGRGTDRSLTVESVAAVSSPALDQAAPIAETVPADERSRAAGRTVFGRSLLPAAWAAGAALVLLRLAVGLLGARRLTREGETVTDPIWRVLIQRFLAAVGLRRTVRLRSHRDVAIPLTWGLFRPVILIPSGHAAWSDDQRSSALFHELSHIKRADFLVLVLVRLSLAAFWFNPLSWIVLARIRKEQEQACDDLVLRAGLKPSTYAANLLLFKRAAGFRWNPSAALLGLFGGSTFNDRLAAILRQRLAFKEVTMKTKLVLGFSIVLTVALIGCARPAAPAVQPAPPPSVAAAAPAVPAQEAVVVQEKKAEQKKIEEKKPAEKKIDLAITTKKESIPLEITIVKGDETKSIRLSDGWTLKEGPEGKVLVLGSGGKEIALEKGEPLRIEISGDKLNVLKESGAGGKNIVVYGAPGVDIVKLGVEAEKLGDEIRKEISVRIDEGKLKELKEKIQALAEEKAKLGDEIRKTIVIKGDAAKLKDEIKKKIAVKIDAAKLKELTEKVKILAAEKGKLAIAIDESGLKDLAEKGAAIAIESGKLEGEIRKATELALAEAHKARARAVIVGEDTKALQEQVKKIQDMLAEVKEKKRDIADLEKAVEKLGAELSAREKETGRSFRIVRPEVRTGVRTIVEPGTVTVIREKEGGESRTVIRPRHAAEAGENVITIKTTEEDGATTLVAVSGGGKSRELYDRAVAQVKKDLPEGMALEPKFDEDSGIITLKIKGSAKAGIPEDLVKKIAAALKDE